MIELGETKVGMVYNKSEYGNSFAVINPELARRTSCSLCGKELQETLEIAIAAVVEAIVCTKRKK